MSLVANCEPGGSQCMSSATMENVPQVMGNKSELTYELMEEFGKLLEVELGNK